MRMTPLLRTSYGESNKTSSQDGEAARRGWNSRSPWHGNNCKPRKTRRSSNELRTELFLHPQAITVKNRYYISRNQ